MDRFSGNSVRTDRGAISLRISVTDSCQFRCTYCTDSPADAGARGEERLTQTEIADFVSAVAMGFGLSKVHLTGGEPLLRDEIVDIVEMLAEEQVPDLAVTTNGHRLAELAEALAGAGLDRVNVSVDSLDPETYARVNGVGAKLERTLQGLQAAMSAGLAPLKINTVVLRNQNLLEAPRLVRWALALGCELRFIELMPLGCIKEKFNELYVSSHEVRDRLASAFYLTPLDEIRGSSSRRFLIEERGGKARGTVGFISPMSHPFCGGCRRIRLTSDGRLLGCLKDPCGISVREALRKGGPSADRTVLGLVSRALGRKGSGHSFGAVKTLAAMGG